jgi:hypothetical protein
MAVDRELQKYYEDRFGMMATQGWLDLMDDIEEMIKSTNSIEGIDDEKNLQFRKGELNMLKWMKSIKSVSEQAYEELNNESN